MNDKATDRINLYIDDDLLTKQSIKALEAALRDNNLSLGQQIEVNSAIEELKKKLEKKD